MVCGESASARQGAAHGRPSRVKDEAPLIASHGSAFTRGMHLPACDCRRSRWPSRSVPSLTRPRSGIVATAAILVVVAAGCGGEATRPADLDRRLIAAAHANDLDEARALIRAGANVNAKDETMQSAYLIATSEVGDDPRLLELTTRTASTARASSGPPSGVTRGSCVACCAPASTATTSTGSAGPRCTRRSSWVTAGT